MAACASMFTMMNNARLNVGLQGVGIAERATQRAVAYAIERKQGQRNRLPVAIADHPDVRRMLLRMRALTTASRALVYYAFDQLGRGQQGDAAAAAARRSADAAGQGVGHRCRLRSRQPGRPGPRRDGLYRGDRRGAAFARCADRADLRRHQRHPGGGPGRAQAGARRRAGVRRADRRGPRRCAAIRG